jgi:hypothetical protein
LSSRNFLRKHETNYLIKHIELKVGFGSIWSCLISSPLRNLIQLGESGMGSSPRAMAAISSTSNNLARLASLCLGQGQTQGNMRSHCMS